VWIKDHFWTGREIEILNEYLFLTAKPTVYLVNLSVNDYKTKKNKYLKNISDWVVKHCPGPIIPYSAEYES